MYPVEADSIAAPVLLFMFRLPPSPEVSVQQHMMSAGQNVDEYAAHTCQAPHVGTEWQRDGRQTSEVHVYLPLQ